MKGRERRVEEAGAVYEEGRKYLESRHHLALFFAIGEIVVILHADEWGQLILNGVI